VTQKNKKEILSILKKEQIKKIRVRSTLPFAPLLFASAIITLLIKGEIIYFLWGLFR
jgi:prepilin signal peptidase PulO-like enzyme (type II secretory pathway)